MKFNTLLFLEFVTTPAFYEKYAGLVSNDTILAVSNNTILVVSKFNKQLLIGSGMLYVKKVH